MEGITGDLKHHVHALAEDIGPRGTYDLAAYDRAARYISDRFKEMGYVPRVQTYLAGGVNSQNIEVEIAGRGPGILVIGAHYDTVKGTGGANDNSSGVAAMLVLAGRLKDAKPAMTIRFVAFANEEPPYFQTARMGSVVYAKACKQRGDAIVGMLSLETIGYYSDEPNSQRYPEPYQSLYPSVGNFIGFVGNLQSKKLLTDAMASFRKHSTFPCEGAAVPDMAPGIGWSDHWAFWQEGYPALMITDTAPFRYAHYHLSSDTPEKLDYTKMTQLVEGLEAMLRELAGVATGR